MNLLPLKEQILDLSRQNNIAPLSGWFSDRLDAQIEDGHFLSEGNLLHVSDYIIEQLIDYREQTGASTVVLGMSGGVDSALTAALFKKAGWTVIGYVMPIHQEPTETDRGVEACKALDIAYHVVDLSDAYDFRVKETAKFDADLLDKPDLKHVKIRLGNIRARERMITLYNAANQHGGLVASTDNFSELVAGFWTLHGDVGDVSPIQSLLKSWEVPFLAKLNGVPESTVRATPTDGLGIDAGDEAQLGSTYLEFDIMTLELQKLTGAMFTRVSSHTTHDELRDLLKIENNSRADVVLAAVLGRIRGSWFKRMNPVNLRHARAERYEMIESIDEMLFRPAVVK